MRPMETWLIEQFTKAHGHLPDPSDDGLLVAKDPDRDEWVFANGYRIVFSDALQQVDQLCPCGIHRLDCDYHREGA